MFTAVVRVTGAGRLEDFRERLRWLMVRDADAEDYTEHHAAGLLEYRFMPRKGIPFPAFAEASREFPELRVEAQWERDGVRGRAVIENGAVVEQAAEEQLPRHVSGRGAHLILAPLQRVDQAGRNAASDERHTFFAIAARAE